jgi:hypothetical protein
LHGKPNKRTERDLTESLGQVQAILAFRRARTFLQIAHSRFHRFSFTGLWRYAVLESPI